jgi:hypothetical protein
MIKKLCNTSPKPKAENQAAIWRRSQGKLFPPFPLETKKQNDVSPTPYNVRQSMAGPVSHTIEQVALTPHKSTRQPRANRSITRA